MFFVLAIMYSNFEYPKDSGSWPAPRPYVEIDKEEEKPNYGFSYINNVFWYVSNVDDADDKSNFLKKYLKYGFAVIPVILSTFINESCFDGDEPFYDFYKRGIYQFNSDFLKNVNNKWCGEKMFCRLSFIYMCLDFEVVKNQSYSKKMLSFFTKNNCC